MFSLATVKERKASFNAGDFVGPEKNCKEIHKTIFLDLFIYWERNHECEYACVHICGGGEGGRESHADSRFITEPDAELHLTPKVMTWAEIKELDA